MSEKLLGILTGKTPPSVYHFSSRAQVKTVQVLAARYNWRCFHVDGHTVHDKASFLQAFAKALHFPDYFGHNWDAFEECIRDLTWLPPVQGYLVLYDEVAPFAKEQPAEWKVAVDILNDAVSHWKKTGQPMVILLRKVGNTLVNGSRL